jgi:hypothetical protein
VSQFYFAWVHPEDTTFGPEHLVEDELIVAFTRNHQEGQKPTLSIDVKNPHIGLLNPSRKRWAWFSIQIDSEITPLFFGRLVGVPANLLGEKVTLLFVADPPDYIARKQTLADELKVLPWYDPLFIDPAMRDDPDTVLESRSASWHVDPVTLEVTISDLLVGEDGDEAFTEEGSDVPRDSVEVSLEGNPLLAVKVDGSVGWTQTVPRTVLDLGTKWIDTYTGGTLIADWPKAGASLGGGWVVAASAAVDFYRVADTEVTTVTNEYSNSQKTHEAGDLITFNESLSKPVLLGPYLDYRLIDEEIFGILDPFADPQVNEDAHNNIQTLYVPKWKVQLSLQLGIEPTRPRTERVLFTLAADLQELVTQPEASDVETLVLTGADAGIAIEGISGGSGLGDPPILDAGRSSYFPTDRGLRSLEYLIARARAHLIFKSRAVRVAFQCTVDRALSLTCRKNATLYDERLPGGVATGKIVECSIGLDGGTGLLVGHVVILCAIGRGNALTSSAGEPDYVELDVIDDEVQHFTGELFALPSEDVEYQVPGENPDDGVVFPLRKEDVVVHEVWHGSVDDQETTLQELFPVMARAAQLAELTNDPEAKHEAQRLNKLTEAPLADKAIWYDLALVPINGRFDAAYDLEVGPLVIPKQIDLEAESFP